MAREMINEMDVEKVVGGSIIFSPDHTTCGLNCNNQCKVNNFSAALNYIKENKNTLTEREMLKNMVSLGYITRL
ncbi:MAG: hypothetical protein IKP72_13775 [Clostridia bacterium]|nr:hypothetical protein [Clostridia bacterium]